MLSTFSTHQMELNEKLFHSLENLAQILNREASGLSKLASRLRQKCSAGDPITQELSEPKIKFFTEY